LSGCSQFKPIAANFRFNFRYGSGKTSISTAIVSLSASGTFNVISNAIVSLSASGTFNVISNAIVSLSASGTFNVISNAIVSLSATIRRSLDIPSNKSNGGFTYSHDGSVMTAVSTSHSSLFPIHHGKYDWTSL
jgi:hypothetical protein